MSVLGLDVGTSTCKGVVLSADGSILAQEQCAYADAVRLDGAKAELPPSCIENGVKTIVAALAARCKDDPIRAIAVSSHGKTLIPIGADGKPLADAMLSMDRRCQENSDGLTSRLGQETIYSITGSKMHPQFPVPKVMYLQQRQPDGMDKAQNDAILEALKNHPEVFCRCASEFPFFPACQKVIEWAKSGKLGQIIEVKAAFNHASDLDPNKPINWKRKNSVNGVYGCMGDLGLHTQHVPFALGWIPETVYAVLSNIITERPDGKGGIAPCDTWDNATMLCTVRHDGYAFPMTLETKRIEPGATDQWYLKINGTKASVYFTSEDPDAFHYLYADGTIQSWSRVLVGSRTLFPTITGENFEFGFSDSILQMWAAYMSELDGKKRFRSAVSSRSIHICHTRSSRLHFPDHRISKHDRKKPARSVLILLVKIPVHRGFVISIGPEYAHVHIDSRIVRPVPEQLMAPFSRHWL